jgi:NitT/TauT family transport system ATP-binding protein
MTARLAARHSVFSSIPGGLIAESESGPTARSVEPGSAVEAVGEAAAQEASLRPVKIRARNIRKAFEVGSAGGAVPALEGVDLDIRSGEFLALVGPSGCGKSTFLDIVAGLSRADSGSLDIEGRPVQGPGLDRGVVFQGYALFPWRTVLENVEFGLEAQGLPKGRRREIAREHIRLVGLEAFEERHPHQLSGGMRQRVAIARALAHDPEILLMDEPFGALDAQTRERLQLEMLKIKQKTAKTVLFVTHSIEEAVLLSDRVAVMTSRPGTIKTIVDISLGGDRGSDPEFRTQAAFVALRHRVWEALHDEVDKALSKEYSR